MSHFLRLLAEADKAAALQTVCARLRQGEVEPRAFTVDSKSFDSIPGKPFAYWVSEAVRETFKRLLPFEIKGRTFKVGLQTSDDYRFVRSWWEVDASAMTDKWFSFAKGGAYSPFYADLFLVVNWKNNGAEIKNFFDPKTGKLISRPQNTNFYLRPGFTWSYRPSSLGSFRFLPKDVVFSVNGSSGFVEGDNASKIAASMAIANSLPYNFLIRLLFSRGGAGGGQTLTYEVGYVAATPVPFLSDAMCIDLQELARRAWSIKRTLDSIDETSHAFVLPAALRARLGDYEPAVIEDELTSIKLKINNIAFDLYDFNNSDRNIIEDKPHVIDDSFGEVTVDEFDDEDNINVVDQTDGLLSWSVGVAFSRFDISWATGLRTAAMEPGPFDALPKNSPGMLAEGDEDFYPHAGILVDDPGHSLDLPRLIEEVLARVESSIPSDVRRWLQRNFFVFHLNQYSKGRRKAPIYWPLSTTSGSFTLWVYYPTLTSQTLYTAINDFVEPKLKLVGGSVSNLRSKGSARSSDDEKQFEVLQALELEMIELRDTMLKLAPKYRPNKDDGVQINSAPLWQMIRNKPWQKVLKDTWAKLEKGDYDWASLAMNYWPERVREKCKTDKSIAIAHGLQELYIEQEAQPKKSRSKNKTEVNQ